jgi:hypothetical protein
LAVISAAGTTAGVVVTPSRTARGVTLPVILVLVVPAALVLAVAVAAVPGKSAARTRPAEILRSE